MPLSSGSERRGVLALRCFTGVRTPARWVTAQSARSCAARRLAAPYHL